MKTEKHPLHTTWSVLYSLLVRTKHLSICCGSAVNTLGTEDHHTTSRHHMTSPTKLGSLVVGVLLILIHDCWWLTTRGDRIVILAMSCHWLGSIDAISL